MISIEPRMDAASADAVGEGSDCAYRRYSSARTSLPTSRTPRSIRRTISRNEPVTLGSDLIADTETFASSKTAPGGGGTHAPRLFPRGRGRVLRRSDHHPPGPALREALM